MSGSPRPRREITCEVCGRHCLAPYKSRDICKVCHRREPSSPCARCGLMKHQLNEETGLCARCSAMFARPTGQCARCARSGLIYDEEAWLCNVCRKIVHHQIRKQATRVEVACSVCGQLRISQLLGRPICASCCREQQNGRGICVQCKRLKVIYVRGDHICKHCYLDRLAPKTLREYVANFTTPYPFNHYLLELLVSSLDWEQVNEKTYRKIRSFGRLLQNQPLPEPLTWEAIEAALPTLSATNRMTPKQIRSCLYNVGHLLVAKGKLESWETFIARRFALLPLEHAPAQIQGILRRYSVWLWEREVVSANVRDHLEALVAFWEWCEPRGIRLPAEVQTPLLNEYLLTLYWQWRCSACQGILPFEPRQRKAPKACPQCGTLYSFTKVGRYAQNTVRGHRARLFVFFSWAKINQLVVAIPLCRKTPAPSPTIQHYPLEVIQQLCEYLVDPDAEPMAALSFYLILFHGLSVWELQHAQLPALHALRADIPVPSLAEAYYLIVPRPAPSMGDCTPGRPRPRLDFSPSAVVWLKPLLDRFEQQRQQIAKNLNNQYLLVARGRARHNTPVSKVFVWEMIQRVSRQVLGAACNPNTLRKSAGVLFTDRAGPGVLQGMGWSDQQAFIYLWAAREVIHPQKVEHTNPAEVPLDAALIEFPSAHESIDGRASE